MSTKLFHGFEFVGIDLVGILDLAKAFRKKVEPLAEESMVNLLAKSVTHKLDNHVMEFEILADKEIEHVISDCFLSILDRIHKVEREHKRDGDVDFEFSFTVHPVPELNRIFGLYFTEQPTFSKLWLEQDNIKEFYYQNCTDRPKDKSQEDWDERARIWNEIILKDSGIPSQCGFTCQVLLNDNVHYFDREKILQAIPSYQNRVDRIVKQLLWNEFSSKIEIENTISSVMKAHREFSEWFSTDDAKEQILVTTETVKQKLPVDLDIK